MLTLTYSYLLLLTLTYSYLLSLTCYSLLLPTLSDILPYYATRLTYVPSAVIS